jgi:hypothetical protein
MIVTVELLYGTWGRRDRERKKYFSLSFLNFSALGKHSTIYGEWVEKLDGQDSNPTLLLPLWDFV